MSTASAMQGSATEQLRSKTCEVRENLKEMGSLATEAAREKFQEAKAGTQECLERSRAKLADTKENVEDFIRERPLQSVLIAAGAGVLVGLLLSRK